MKYIILFLLLQNAIWSYGQSVDTFDVYFGLNEAKLSPKGSAYIRKLIADGTLVRGQKLALLGYADHLGTSGHNDSLSAARAANVAIYLIKHGISKTDIYLCEGSGAIARDRDPKDGYSPDRKVQIIIAKDEAPSATPFQLNIEMVKVTGNGFNFAIGKYQLTQAQWQAVTGEHPSEHMGCDSCPVETISIYKINAFLKKLDSLTGKHYRLPTEAEWEYAARGGSKGHKYYFAGSDNMNEVGWHAGNSGNSTHPVGQKKPNELGIYDMCGNVWQWCQNPPDSVQHPVAIRGGTFFLRPPYCRIDYKITEAPVSGNGAVGFRVAYSL